MELSKNNIKDYFIVITGTLLIFSVSIKGWINNINSDLNVSFISLIYLLFFILCIINLNNLVKFFKYLVKRNFRSLDFNILLSILLFFLIQQNINFYALSFVSIYFYINSIVFCTSNFYRDYRYIFLTIIIAGFLSSMGVVIGVLEAIFFETNYFYKIKTDYPSFISFEKHFSGFQFTYNYTAYLIIASLGIIRFVEDNFFNQKFLKLFFVITLLLTQSKVGYLFIALLLAYSLKGKFLIIYRYFFVPSIIFGYVFLSHLTIKLSTSEFNLSYYIREEKFAFFDLYGYSTLFLWLKEKFFEYTFNNDLSKISLSGFQKIAEGTEPHSLLFSSYLFGGTIFSFLLLYRIIKNLRDFFILSYIDSFFTSLVLTFFVESIIWDSYDAPIFWLIILLCPFYKRFMEQRKIQLNI